MGNIIVLNVYYIINFLGTTHIHLNFMECAAYCQYSASQDNIAVTISIECDRVFTMWQCHIKVKIFIEPLNILTFWNGELYAYNKWV